MFKETIILIAASLLITLSQSHKVFAEDTNGTSESTQTEKQAPSDFEDWYKPDNAYPDDNKQQTTENQDKASGPDEGPFLAPGDDERSKVR
ncbi:MAG TPA: hypothetical protein VHC46_05550 [Thermodesulfobacteriota bacterium]|nr:hypothetical protein [Thermodesulfobacteriota bacterium]